MAGADASSGPGWGISAVGHDMVCDVCFDCSSTTDERLARAEFRKEVAGLPSSAHFGPPFCFFGFGGGTLVFPGLSGKTLVALTCESGGDR